MNDWNFLVREVGRGRGVQERSLEIAEVLRGQLTSAGVDINAETCDSTTSRTRGYGQGKRNGKRQEGRGEGKNR